MAFGSLEAFCGPERTSRPQMPVASACCDLPAAWALVCILQILVTDCLPPWETCCIDPLAAPPPGLEPQNDQLSCGACHRHLPQQRCQCRYCGFSCCRAGQPHSIHRCTETGKDSPVWLRPIGDITAVPCVAQHSTAWQEISLRQVLSCLLFVPGSDFLSVYV